MDPAPHIGRCLRPMGPVRVSGYDVAEILSRVLGRSVTYTPISGRFFSRVARAYWFPTFQIAQVVRYAEELREGVYDQQPNDVVARVTGRPAEDFETIARRYLAEPDRIWPGMSAGRCSRRCGSARASWPPRPRTCRPGRRRSRIR